MLHLYTQRCHMFFNTKIGFCTEHGMYKNEKFVASDRSDVTSSSDQSEATKVKNNLFHESCAKHELQYSY